MQKKRALTLLEMMIVILLITLVTGVIGYNMKGALDKGKNFRTTYAKDQLRDLLLYRSVDQGIALENLVHMNREDLAKELEQTGLAKNAVELLKDGWGEDFEIKLKGNKDLSITSRKQIAYEKKNRSKHAEISSQEEEEVY